MPFCIPKPLAQTLKNAASEGEITVQGLFDMSSKERRDLFQKYTNEATAKEINLGFEKAMVSSREEALENWVKATFKGEKKATERKTMLSKIEELKDKGLLDTKESAAMFEDLASDKLGLNITADEVKKVVGFSDELQKLSKKEGEFGMPSVEYWKKLRETQDYMDALTPTHKLKVVTSVLFRGNMLFKTASAVLNITSNTIFGINQAILRRVKNIGYKGVDTSLMTDYVKYANKVYKETGYDVTRMMNIEQELRIRGERFTQAQGPGAVRAAGRFYEDLVFKKMQGAPDVAFSSFARADSTLLTSYQVAKAEGLTGKALEKRAKQLFEDSIGLNQNISPEAILVREKSIFDAQVATLTQDSVWSDVSLGIRDVLNSASGDFRVGDINMPFVKTPANVIGKTIDASGLTLPLKFVDGLNKLRKGAATKEVLTDMMTSAAEAGLGWTAAIAVASMIGPTNFIGNYPTNRAERELLKSGNATTNSIKVGDKWISLDFLGPVGAPLLGALYARKYKSRAAAFYGAGAQLLNVPGLEQIVDMATDMKDFLDPSKDVSGEKLTGDVKKATGDFIAGRFLPGFLGDVAKGTDPYQREVSPDSFFDPIIRKIPGFRKVLKEKRSIFGDVLETESLSSYMLFGSRVKTGTDNPAMLELERLYSTGNVVGITNAEWSSTRVKEVKAGLSEEDYDKFISDYRSDLNEDMNKEIKKKSYEKLSDEEKADKLDKLESDILNDILNKPKYKRARKKGKQE